ncbi:MAG: tryptophan 7-halogenase [Phycisphaeraceae bacterium]|nr:tryptophan 7-halogenase [Phycisphaeraceae bacterium]
MPAQTRQDMYDVVIIGGGPGGATTGTLLKKYSPEMRVAILEKERFPRDHVGESQLPPISRVLDEMGVWDKIEAAGFPIKIGATYTWGKTVDPWVFGFIPLSEVKVEPRPGRYDGWRQRTAFQVDRARYDEILLRHAAACGCDVREGTQVREVLHEGDRITGVRLDDGTTIEGRYYIDSSGNAAVIRRQLGVRVDAPTLLRNVAFWDYWSAPGLNNPIYENGTARVLIRSLPYGWLWYIALSADRTSVGLVTPADYYKASGKRPEELYLAALSQEQSVARLLAHAASRGRVESTNDWSYVAERTHGPNWFLVGESLGFADPILAAGLTLTHTCARHCAYTILEIERGNHDRDWLLRQYDDLQRRRVMQHMKFAEYWYSANGCFADIQENCTRIAQEAGLTLDPQEAFRWLSNGGIDDDIGQVAIGGLDLAGIKGVQQRLSHATDSGVKYKIDGKNTLKLNLIGAEKTFVAALRAGRIERVEAYRRGPKTLIATGVYGAVIEALKKTSDVSRFNDLLRDLLGRRLGPADAPLAYRQAIQCLEVMVNDYWVLATFKPGRPALSVSTPSEGELIYSEHLGPPSSRDR